MAHMAEEGWERYVAHLLDHGQSLFGDRKEPDLGSSKLEGWQKYIAERMAEGKYYIEKKAKK
ncbi:MAG: hypothetical protein QXG10_03720 [Candidatus Hadarchaeales archaeon]